MQEVDVDKPISQILESLSVDPNVKRKYDEASMINAIKTMQETRLLPSEVETKNNALRYTVDEWFTQRMRERYQELSPEIFELKREIVSKPNQFLNSEGKPESNRYGHTVKLEIPMFLTAELGKDEGWKKEFRLKDSYDSDKVSLFSRIPPVPLDVRKAGKEALAFAYKTYSDALVTEEISDIITVNQEYAPNPAHAELRVLWKPKPSEIYVEVKKMERDPALVLQYQKPYLVTTWTVPEEEPFMSILSACKISDMNRFE